MIVELLRLGVCTCEPNDGSHSNTYIETGLLRKRKAMENIEILEGRCLDDRGRRSVLLTE
jgi:hypothetical protein